MSRSTRRVRIIALSLTLAACLATWKAVPAMAGDPAGPVGSGDGRIHLIPSLHPYSVKDGEILRVSVLVKSREPVVSVKADLGGVAELELHPRPSAGTHLLPDGEQVTVYEGEWTAAGLEERVYEVSVSVVDSGGHGITDRSLRFSDPAAGHSRRGRWNIRMGG